MSLLDDARRLAGPDLNNNLDGRNSCPWCVEFYGQHGKNCPWLAMPRIVAVIEAAERVTAIEYGPVNSHCRCHWCDEFSASEDHLPDCPWHMLVVALKGGESA